SLGPGHHRRARDRTTHLGALDDPLVVKTYQDRHHCRVGEVTPDGRLHRRRHQRLGRRPQRGEDLPLELARAAPRGRPSRAAAIANRHVPQSTTAVGVQLIYDTRSRCRRRCRRTRGATVISYFQAIVIGLLQGVTELFPISSLGHSVLVPAWLGWDHLVTAQSADESFYLAFVVALHVATAIALLVYFRSEWVKIIAGFFRTLRTRRIETPDERLAWLLVVATVPAGITGLALEHALRTLFAKPLAAAVFLTVNGLILLAGERVRRRAAVRQLVVAHATDHGPGEEEGRRLDTLDFKEAGAVGIAQIG